MTIDEAIRSLRNDVNSRDLVRNAYLGRDVRDSVERFASSGEFAAVLALLGTRVAHAEVLDLGAGIGMASEAFRRAGAGRVIAVEPDASDEVGRSAMARALVRAEVVDALGEALPFSDESLDIVYCRQVLHHAADLEVLVREAARVLRSGGAFLACREHVASNASELTQFLAAHPVHRLAGGENALPLPTYLRAFALAGFRVEKVVGPWDSVINAFPVVQSDKELHDMPRAALMRRFGRVGSLLAALPWIVVLVRRRIQPVGPGRLYSFLAVKP